MNCKPSSSAAIVSDSKHKLGSQATEWLTKHETNLLTEQDIKDYWAKQVPKFYSPRRDCDCLNIIYDEDKAKEELFTPLERFMAASVDTDSMFESLKDLDDPPTLCGRVFKNGEPTYSCRDCSLDPTCVLCVDCFKNRYDVKALKKISNSFNLIF